MPAPIKGTAGAVKIGPTGTETTFVWVGKWKVKTTRKKETIGPHVGDENEYPVSTSVESSFEVEGTIPQDTDAAQDLLFTATLDGTTPQLVLYAIKGKKATFAAPVYEEFEIEQDGKGSHTFKAKGSGVMTLADGPTS